MAIVIGSNFSYNGLLYLDERQGLPKTASDLKNWKTNVPEGFEVYLPADGEWYVYKSTYNESTTGHFRKRNQDNENDIKEINDNLDRIDANIDEIEADVDRIDETLKNTNTNLANLTNDTTNKYNVIFADKFNDLLQDSNWNFNSKNYAAVGIRVSVVNDGANNGVYRLKASDYKTATNWVRLVERDDLILSGDNNKTTSADTNIYTAKRTDEKFIRRDIPEHITEDLTVDNLTVETSDIKDLPEHIFENVKVGVNNMLKNSSFAGEYDTAELSPDLGLNSKTELYSQSYEYWKGVGSWEVVEDPESVTGFSVTLGSNSELSQTVESTMISGENYVISYKAKGSITASIDGNTYSTTTTLADGYQFYEYKFKYSGASSCTVKFTGSGSLCEPKLERGTVSTSWFPSSNDTDPVANLINEYQYLKTAFKEYNDNCASGLLLKEVIQAVKYIDGAPVGDAKAGLSGIYNNEGNVFVWSGGDYASANRLMGKIDEDPNYFPTDEELQNVAKFAVTFGGSVFLNARGKFRGGLSTRLSGARIELDPSDASLRMYNINNDEVFSVSSGTDLNTSNGKFMIVGKNWPTNENEVEDGGLYLNQGILSVKGVDVTIEGADTAIPTSTINNAFDEIFG